MAINTIQAPTNTQSTQTTPSPGGDMGWVGNADTVIKAWETKVRDSFAAAVADNKAGLVPIGQAEIGRVLAALNAHTARSVELYPGRMDHGKSLVESAGQLYVHESGMGPGGSVISNWSKVVGDYQMPVMPMY